MTKVEPKNIAKGIHYCIKNADVFLEDAKLLFKKDKMRGSYLLVLYSLEEMGKVPMVLNLTFHSDTDKELNKWRRRFIDHKEKFWFSKDIDDFNKGFFAKKENKNEEVKSLDKLKISYVDFSSDKNEFTPPAQVTKSQVENVIKIAEKRLEFLKNTHTSIRKDVEEIKNSRWMRGLSEKQILELALKMKSRNQ